MADENKNSEVKELKDETVEQVSGGGLFGYDEEVYWEAGIKPSPIWYNYEILASHECITKRQADAAVSFYREYGRPVSSLAELEEHCIF